MFIGFIYKCLNECRCSYKINKFRTIIPFQLLSYSPEVFSSLKTCMCPELWIHLHFSLSSKAESAGSENDPTIHSLVQIETWGLSLLCLLSPALGTMFCMSCLFKSPLIGPFLSIPCYHPSSPPTLAPTTESFRHSFLIILGLKILLCSH